MNTQNLNAVAEAAEVPADAPKSLMTEAQDRAIIGAAVDLSNADRQFESAIADVAKAVALVMGTAPTFAFWVEVQTTFVTRYAEAREVKEETARQRWVKVAALMESEYALEKPAKPSKAAEVKAAQREGAAGEAAALIERAKATTPAQVLALSAPTEGEPVKPQVVAALAAEAARMAREAGKEANESARAEVKTLRDEIRKALPTLTLAQLRAIRDMLPKAEAPAEAETPEGATTE